MFTYHSSSISMRTITFGFSRMFYIIMLNEVEEDYHLRRNMWIDSLKEMINDMSEEELRDAYLNMLIELNMEKWQNYLD